MKFGFQKKDYFLSVLFFFIGIISRFPLIEKMQSHWDGPDYTLALIKYSFAEQTPSPPGYPLYIAIGRVFHLFIQDPHMAILAVSVMFAGVGAMLFYLVGNIIFNSKVGIIAASIFLSAPTIYFFGITANPYGILPITAAILACIVYSIKTKKENYGLLLGLGFSFAIGIRPQDTIFLLPLAIFGLCSLNIKQRYISLVAFLIVSFSWFFWISFLLGGPNRYIYSIISSAESSDFKKFSIFNASTVWFFMLKGLYLTLGLAGTFLLYYIKKLWTSKRNFGFVLDSRTKDLIILFSLWIIPSLFFNAIVRSDHAAHQMAYLSALIFLTSFAIWKITRKRIFLQNLLLVLIICFNLFTFFRDRDPGNKKPYVSQSYHYSEIRKNDLRLKGIVSFIESHLDSNKTIVLSDPEIFRPVMYHLKDYRVYAYSKFDQKDNDTIHFGYKWDYKILIGDTLTIPGNINTIISITNNKIYRFPKIKSVKKFTLAGNSFIYVFQTKLNSRYLMKIHTIESLN